MQSAMLVAEAADGTWPLSSWCFLAGGGEGQGGRLTDEFCATAARQSASFYGSIT